MAIPRNDVSSELSKKLTKVDYQTVSDEEDKKPLSKKKKTKEDAKTKKAKERSGLDKKETPLSKILNNNSKKTVKTIKETSDAVKGYVDIVCEVNDQPINLRVNKHKADLIRDLGYGIDLNNCKISDDPVEKALGNVSNTDLNLDKVTDGKSEKLDSMVSDTVNKLSGEGSITTTVSECISNAIEDLLAGISGVDGGTLKDRVNLLKALEDICGTEELVNKGSEELESAVLSTMIDTASEVGMDTAKPMFEGLGGKVSSKVIDKGINNSLTNGKGNAREKLSIAGMLASDYGEDNSSYSRSDKQIFKGLDNSEIETKDSRKELDGVFLNMSHLGQYYDTNNSHKPAQSNNISMLAQDSIKDDSTLDEDNMNGEVDRDIDTYTSIALINASKRNENI